MDPIVKAIADTLEQIDREGGATYEVKAKAVLHVIRVFLDETDG